MKFLPEADLIAMRGGKGKLLEDLIITVMQEFHEIDIEKMGKIPIPTFFAIVRKMSKDSEEMKSSHKQ